MHISLDRNGRVVQSGEGSHRVPMGADEVDNTLSNPVAQAQNLWDRNRDEYATMAAAADQNAQDQQAAAAYQAWMQTLANDYQEYVAASSSEENGGENPMLYAAAMQTMAGGGQEQWTPLGGYLLSQDGQFSPDNTMNGEIRGGLGQVTALIQDAQNAASQAAAVVAPLTALTSGGALPSAAAPAPSASSLSAMLAPYMAQKVLGYPLPYVVGAGLVAFLFLRKK